MWAQIFAGFENLFYFCTPKKGEVLEWLKRHAWKACIPQKGIRGSNPRLSATNAENQQIAKQTPSFAPKNVKSGVFVLFKIIQPLHNKREMCIRDSMYPQDYHTLLDLFGRENVFEITREEM